MENKIRDFLKLIKVNENTISMFLGLGVVAIIAVMIVNYFRETPASLPTIDDSTISQVLDDIRYDEASESAESSESGNLAQVVATPTIVPTVKPTVVPPTATPTLIPSPTPTIAPSNTPTPLPTLVPTATVVPEPTITTSPTAVPTIVPSPTPTPAGQIAGGVSTSNDEQVAGANQQKYTVVKGDNLWMIAEKTYKTGYGWVEIAKANNMTSKTVGLIEVGQELNIPQLEKQYPTTVADQQGNVAQVTDNNDNAAPNITTANNYTVVRGDNLWNIARAAYGDGFKWTTIYEANKEIVTSPGYIEVGMNLKLPRS